MRLDARSLPGFTGPHMGVVGIEYILNHIQYIFNTIKPSLSCRSCCNPLVGDRWRRVSYARTTAARRALHGRPVGGVTVTFAVTFSRYAVNWEVSRPAAGSRIAGRNSDDETGPYHCYTLRGR